LDRDSLPMQVRKKFTPAAISQIRCWVEQGLSAAEIAQRIGCTLGTLRVKCSQLGISLRLRCESKVDEVYRSNGNRSVERDAELSDSRDRLVLSIPQGTMDLLEIRATSKGVSGSKYAATLLEKVAEDDLYEAILDDR
jgi:hypothetical protein